MGASYSKKDKKQSNSRFSIISTKAKKLSDIVIRVDVYKRKLKKGQNPEKVKIRDSDFAVSFLAHREILDDRSAFDGAIEKALETAGMGARRIWEN